VEIFLISGIKGERACLYAIKKDLTFGRKQYNVMEGKWKIES
jgi:hypothetical protein